MIKNVHVTLVTGVVSYDGRSRCSDQLRSSAMKTRSTPIVLAALSVALLLGTSSYAQDRPTSVPAPPPSSHKSLLKGPANTAGKVTEVPLADAKMKDIPDTQRSDNANLK
jgi:hypothetical protein